MIDICLMNDNYDKANYIYDWFIKYKDNSEKEHFDPINDVFNKYYVGRFFDLEMIGGKKNKEHFIKEYERFDYNKFKSKEKYKIEENREKNYYSDFLKNYQEIGKSISDYVNLVYQKVRSAHFILLDFFLNSENSYLGFDFISDIEKLKYRNNDFRTTWYFITSAVYDSVVKYSESGILAEFYESAVINSGDDPTRKNRQIIFLYKLFTFINSRITTFENHKGAILNCNVFNCRTTESACKVEKGSRCLLEIQGIIRKYLAEYHRIIEIFPSTRHEEEKLLKDNVELMDRIINQFYWLPEADWPIIQMQIDMLNQRLDTFRKGNLKKLKFSCAFINNEIEKRSKVY